jgi:hypothetical protein
VYSFVPREQIAETLIHLRGLFRESPLSNEKDYRAQERREIPAIEKPLATGTLIAVTTEARRIAFIVVIDSSL